MNESPIALRDKVPADPTMPPPARVSFGIWLMNLLAVVMPFLGVIAAAISFWGYGFSFLHLGLMLGMYVVTGLGVTVGYHRLFSHRAFETPRFVKFILAVMGSMAVEGPLLKWTAQHRRHHQHSDQDGDPHSPHLHGKGFWGFLTGLWHAHMGWIFLPDAKNLLKYIPDLSRSRLLRVTSSLFPLWVVLSLAIPTALGGLLTLSWTGALLGLIWGGLVRIFIVHHITWSINSVCHLWGSRPFQTSDRSRNNFLFGILAFGEGWHNNHHAFPTSARHGLRWWQIDISYWIIRALALFGLAWNIKRPAAHLLIPVPVRKGQ